MIRYLVFFLVVLVSLIKLEARNSFIVVADSATHEPLASVSILDKNAVPIGQTNEKGILPIININRYPLTLRCVGYNEKTIPGNQPADTLFLSENISVLPEVVIESKKYPLLHLLAYVREYSTLTTYTDTIFLFREKMVDYMLPLHDKVNFKGWKTPRILSSKSYYRFTDQAGLDSVSDECLYHFSWSDWVGLPPQVSIPMMLINNVICADTLKGKYSPVEIWSRTDDTIDVSVNMLADTTVQKWLPSLAGFFNKGVDYDKFSVDYSYKNVIGKELSTRDLEGYSYSIESTGRGRNMFRFNRKDEPYYVSTDAEIYIIDKEYITQKEANKWDKRNFNFNDIDIFVSPEAKPLSPAIIDLMARVENIDKNEIRLKLKPDKRIGHAKEKPNLSMGQKALFFLKKLLKI